MPKNRLFLSETGSFAFGRWTRANGEKPAPPGARGDELSQFGGYVNWHVSLWRVQAGR